MLEFNTNIEEVISAQTKAAKEKAFINMGTKKQIMESDLLNDVQKDYINRLKSTYAFDLHKDGRYIVITMYYGSTKKYEFIILDLETFKCATAQSIKMAKEAVLELVNSAIKAQEEAKEVPENVTEETPAETPEIQESPVEETKPEGKTVSKKHNSK